MLNKISEKAKEINKQIEMIKNPIFQNDKEFLKNELTYNIDQLQLLIKLI